MRIRTRVFLATATAVFALGPSPALADPNVVLILTDDQRWDTLSAMPTVQSDLVEKGVTFVNAFTVNPLCCPSRASLLIGRYSHGTGVYDNRGARGLPALDERSTIAIRLKAAGYHTAFIGKYLNGYATTRVPPGWDRWVAFSGTSRTGRRPAYYEYDLAVDGTRVAYGSGPADYSTDVLAEHAVDFIHAAREPFFLVYAPLAPHSPAVPAPRHATAFPGLEPWRPLSYDEPDASDKPPWLRHTPRIDAATTRWIDDLRANQLRSLLAVDDAVGSILGALREEGQLPTTLVLYTSDNGQFWGEHRLRAKMAAYDESIRVPLVARYDGLTEATPRTDDRLAASIDIAPTLAQLAGQQMPADGLSLLPLLAGAESTWRKSFLIENLGPTGGVPTYCAVRARNWAYVILRTGEEELYDLVADPLQLTNLARNPAFHRQLLTMRARVRELCHPPPPGMSLNSVCTQEGTTQPETLRGTPRPDGLCGRGGNDLLLGGGGRDLLRGEGGRDRLVGGAGGDLILAHDGVEDAVRCGRGRDRVDADPRDEVAADCEQVGRRL